MKTALLLALLPVCALADVEIDRTTAANMKSYTVNELSPKVNDVVGQIIKLKFTSRRSEIEQGGDLHMSYVTNYSRTTTKRGADPFSSTIRVAVGNDGLPWFKKVNVDTFSTSPVVAIGRVEKNKDEGVYVLLVGREIKTDAKGSKIVW